MSKAADSSEPASEVERLIADLSASGELIFVFGDGLTTAHLTGTTTPEFRGPADRRWWHVTLGDDAASWTMSVRVDEITGVRFVREPYPFVPHFPGQEVLVVLFLGPGGDTVLHCYVGDLYDGQRMRPEKLAAWQALRERYGDRDESRVEQGTLLARQPEPAGPGPAASVPHPCQNGRTATAMRSRFLVLESRSRLPRHWRPSGSPVASWPKLTTNGRSPTCATCPKAPWHSWPRGLPTRRR